LLTLAYAGSSPRKVDAMQAQVRRELEAMLQEHVAPQARA